MHALAFLVCVILFVPTDNRPVTLAMPAMLGRIAGVAVKTPPHALLGKFLHSGDPDAILQWLNREAAQSKSPWLVLSVDMLAYGGLVASRVPDTPYADAYSRLMELAHLRAEYRGRWIGAFGTIMRLAPTGTPAGSGYFAAYPVWTYLQAYANLHDPPLPSERAKAQQLQAQIGPASLNGYLEARGRDLAIDRLLLKLTETGTIDRLVLGQDDAGAVGLHFADVQLLQSELGERSLSERAAIEPGADELGMALVTHAIARKAAWTPRVAVHYSTPGGADFEDPLEYAPVSETIEKLIRLCGAVVDDAHPDIVLYVRVPRTSAPQDDALVTAIVSDVDAGRSVALADLSYLVSYQDQALFAQRILDSGLAARLDAYSSWNTNANTVGTALAEAIAAGAGRRMGTYDALAHRTFTFVRFLDDYAFHDEVRPQLNAALDAQGITDHTLLTPDVAAAAERLNRALLWSYVQPILGRLDPGYHVASMSITLPWDRTFETAIEVGIAPNL